jgi:protein-L-isoaspartate O-methyltransferase
MESRPHWPASIPTEALGLEGGERALEISAGSGYAAAILSKIAGEVYTVERIGQLAEKAASTLADLGYSCRGGHRDRMRMTQQLSRSPTVATIIRDIGGSLCLYAEPHSRSSLARNIDANSPS